MQKKLILGITIPGSVILLEGQMRYFTELGYNTYLMSPKSEGSLAYCEKEGCQLLDVDIEREISILKDISTLVNIIRTLRKIKPDIVNYGTPKMSLLGMMGARMCNVPRRIYTCRGFRYEHEKGFKRWMLKRMEWFTAVCAHKIICISSSVMDMGIKDKVFSSKKCMVVKKGSSNGINLQRFNAENISTNEKKSLKKKLELDNYFVFGYVGRLIDRKGITELYEAFNVIFNKNENTRLLILGTADEKQISDRSIILKLKKHPGIIWPGRTDNVPLYLSLMDIFLLPAWWEGFGNVLVQAAAMGVPVISTKATGSKDAVKDGYNGILIEPKSVKELTNAMQKLYDDKDLRQSMGKNGLEWAKNFNSQIIWDEMNKLYLS